ncbi:MAG: type secretion system protein ImpA [Pseudomonadota bacterium]|jgi:type VI secretion system protein ImpA
MNPTLLPPVRPEAPCGEDLSFSREFDAIEDMRRFDDPSLDQGEWVTRLKVADWPGVETACAALLRDRTKDLRVANWYAEALTSQRGYAGLAEGLQLCAALCEQYWPDLHPRPEHGDHEQRVGTLNWLLTRTEALAPRLPVLRSAGTTYSLADLAEARHLQAAIERDPDDAVQMSEGRVTLAELARAQKETPAAWLREQWVEVKACNEALARLQAVVDTHLGAEGPSFVSARDALQECQYGVERLVRELGGAGLAGQSEPARAEPGAVVSGAGSDAPGAEPGDAPIAATGPLRSRDQALAQLREVAAFFRRTEPHSPVAYLADKAAQWGEMPLHLWLKHVVKDPAALSQLEDLLGTQDAPTA